MDRSLILHMKSLNQKLQKTLQAIQIDSGNADGLTQRHAQSCVVQQKPQHRLKNIIIQRS